MLIEIIVYKIYNIYNRLRKSPKPKTKKGAFTMKVRTKSEQEFAEWLITSLKRVTASRERL